MANVTVQKVNPVETVNLEDGATADALFRSLENAMVDIRNRAFELFRRRGSTPGFEVEDWLRAERELFAIPNGEMLRTGDMYSIRLEVPGFNETNVEVTTTPEAIVIRGKTETEFRSEESGVAHEEFRRKSLYRRYEFEMPVDVSKVTAEIDKGVLKILAPVRSIKPVRLEKKTMATEKTLTDTVEPKGPLPARTAAA